MGVALVVVTILGVVGFTRYQQDAGTLQPIATRLYLSIQLFVLESGSVSGSLPWELHVARFAAPIVGAYALIRAIGAVLQEQVGLLRLKLVRDHVVVAGLGRMGLRLADTLLQNGERVVVIEADAANPGLGAVRAMGGLVVVGDARAATIQQRARVGHADRLVVLCGSDGTNIEIAAQARKQVGGSRSPRLHCLVHLANPDLALLLCAEELERYHEAPIRVDFINLHALAAQALLSTHPPFEKHAGELLPVSVVGSGQTAHHLLLALARAWAARSQQGGQRLAVTVVRSDTQALVALEVRHPELSQYLEMEAVADLGGVVAKHGPAVVYVCPDDDEQAAASALELRALLAGHPARIVLVLEERAGLGRLLEGAQQPVGGPSLVTFGRLEETCQPGVLLTGTTEVLARALHGAYLEAPGPATSEGDPALRPWSDLPESLRESNRDQASHLAVKLAAIGQAIGPLTDWRAAQQPFTEEDVELMARLEHDRWATERRDAGWRMGPRDALHRTTPYLVPWEQLSDQIRDQDRMFVRQLPRLLASVGLQAMHMRETGTPGPRAADPDAAGSAVPGASR